jgi:hypothetical protein
MAKDYLRVTAVFSEDGGVVPVAFRLPDGREFSIDRVSDRRPAPSLKVGGQGIRYTCTVLGRKVYLFLDENKWFLEKV